jgi:hypothetical protein
VEGALGKARREKREREEKEVWTKQSGRRRGREKGEGKGGAEGAVDLKEGYRKQQNNGTPNRKDSIWLPQCNARLIRLKAIKV